MRNKFNKYRRNKAKRSDVPKHTCKDTCQMVLLERPYNQLNKWDLRCRVSNRHYKWLSKQEASHIWDMVPHRTMMSRKKVAP
jgi:hypothetical protein